MAEVKIPTPRGEMPSSPMGYRAAGRLERALEAVWVDHDIKVYSDVSHGFLNDHPPADRTALLMVLNAISGTRYHEPSAQDARRRIVAFRCAPEVVKRTRSGCRTGTGMGCMASQPGTAVHVILPKPRTAPTHRERREARPRRAG
jgi:Dienelactone hydrolase family